MKDERVIDRDALLELCIDRADALLETAKAQAGNGLFREAGAMLLAVEHVEALGESIRYTTKHARREGEEF